MSVSMTQFSESQLRQIGEQARAEHDEIVGKCYEICHTFGNILIDLGLPYRDNSNYQVYQVRIGENGEEPHYVFELNTEYYQKEVSKCIVDLSMDQFNDENRKRGIVDVSLGPKRDINQIHIYHRSPERIRYYTTTSQFLSN